MKKASKDFGSCSGVRVVFLTVFLMPLLVCVCVEARQREYHLAGELQTHGEMHVFSGSTLEVVFHHIDARPDAPILAADLYQKSTSLVATVMRDVVPDSVVELFAGAATREVKLKLDVPEVQRQSSFFLILKSRQPDSEAWRMAGRITLRVYPPLDWEGLRARSRDVVFWQQDEGEVARFLRENGFEIFPFGAPQTLDQPGFILQEKVDIDAGKVEKLARGQTLFRLGSSPDVSMPRIERKSAGLGTVVKVFWKNSGDLSRHPESQRMLYDMIEASLQEWEERR